MMCVFNPELDEDGLETATERVKTLIAARGGEVTSLEPWGRRRLAYSIKGFRDGFYAVTRFTMPPDQTDVLDRNLRLTEALIRHLIVRPETA
jgi:small subunit ribosomal protein S6